MVEKEDSTCIHISKCALLNFTLPQNLTLIYLKIIQKIRFGLGGVFYFGAFLFFSIFYFFVKPHDPYALEKIMTDLM